jgi:hypothetical protein
MAASGRSGASIYDALIGLTAKLAGAEIYNADLRATAVYDLLEVDWQSCSQGEPGEKRNPTGTDRGRAAV